MTTLDVPLATTTGLLTLEQAAASLGMPGAEKAVRRLVARGDVDVVAVGDSLRIAVDDWRQVLVNGGGPSGPMSDSKKQIAKALGFPPETYEALLPERAEWSREGYRMGDVSYQLDKWSLAVAAELQAQFPVDKAVNEFTRSGSILLNRDRLAAVVRQPLAPLPPVFDPSPRRLALQAAVPNLGTLYLTAQLAAEIARIVRDFSGGAMFQGDAGIYQDNATYLAAVEKGIAACQSATGFTQTKIYPAVESQYMTRREVALTLGCSLDVIAELAGTTWLKVSRLAL